MTPEEAYEEARRRIRKAEEAGSVKLDLSRLALNRLPRELAGLPSLQSLNLAACDQLNGSTLRDISSKAIGQRRRKVCLLSRIFGDLTQLIQTIWTTTMLNKKAP